MIVGCPRRSSPGYLPIDVEFRFMSGNGVSQQYRDYYHGKHKSKALLKGLRVHAQTGRQVKRGTTDEWYAWRNEYDAYMVALDDAERMVKGLRKVDRKHISISDEQGYAPDFAEFVRRTAAAFNVKWAARPDDVRGGWTIVPLGEEIDRLRRTLNQAPKDKWPSKE